MLVLWSACSVGHSCACPPKKSTMTAGSTIPVRTASPSTQTTLAVGTTLRARPCTASDTVSRRALSVKLALCSGSGRRPTAHRTTELLTAATRSCWGPLAGTLTSAVGPARTASARCPTPRSLEPQGLRTPAQARDSRSSEIVPTSAFWHPVARHPPRSPLCQRPRQLQLRQLRCQPQQHPRHHPCQCLSPSQSPSLHQCRC
mmetsp:Transcript_13983/g.29283  ORF Transcript_13983/g.29283 Transcript_13983/m.29283 type:complete len:202 (-) Transcript_13983:69-674(-)